MHTGAVEGQRAAGAALGVVEANPLGYVAAAQRTVLHSIAADLTAAHVTARQEDDLRLQRTDTKQCEAPQTHNHDNNLHTKPHSRLTPLGRSVPLKTLSADDIMEQINTLVWFLVFVEIWLTPVSMQTTHSELPGPSNRGGPEGVTGVPGLHGGLGVCMAELLCGTGGDGGGGAEGPASLLSSFRAGLPAPAGAAEGQPGGNILE